MTEWQEAAEGPVSPTYSQNVRFHKQNSTTQILFPQFRLSSRLPVQAVPCDCASLEMSPCFSCSYSPQTHFPCNSRTSLNSSLPSEGL